MIKKREVTTGQRNAGAITKNPEKRFILFVISSLETFVVELLP